MSWPPPSNPFFNPGVTLVQGTSERLHRTLFDSRNRPVLPAWASATPVITELREPAEHNQAENYIEIVYQSPRPTIQSPKFREKFSNDARWEERRLLARVDTDTENVWLVLEVIWMNKDWTEGQIVETWHFFDEFMANYPKTCMLLTGVFSEEMVDCLEDQSGGQAEHNSLWPEQIAGVIEDDADLTSFDTRYPLRTLSKAGIRRAWYKVWGKNR